MKNLKTYAAMAWAAFVLPIAASASAEVGSPAPEFTLVSAEGNSHSLSDFRGKFVVLEWVNHSCPFVVKHYDSGNMQKLQATYTGKDVVWLSICSSGEGRQGYMEAAEIKAARSGLKTAETAYLLDSDGNVGRAYGAKRTPEMFVIDPEGKLIYHGAIDSERGTDASSIESATNYVAAVLDAAMAGSEIPYSKKSPYGCSIKY